MTTELIPITQVVLDMESKNSWIASAAKAYYYTHYATPKEQADLDKADLFNKTTIAFLAINAVLTVFDIAVCLMFMIFR